MKKRYEDHYYLETKKPTMIFLQCEDKYAKKTYNKLKKLKWIHHLHVLTGNAKYRIAIYMNIDNAKDYEKYVSYLESLPYIHAVSEYPSYRYVTNGVKMNSKNYSAYYFLRGKGNLNKLWNKFKHSKHLVHINEVPGSYDFIMYAENDSQKKLTDFWKTLTTSFHNVEASFCTAY